MHGFGITGHQPVQSVVALEYANLRSLIKSFAKGVEEHCVSDVENGDKTSVCEKKGTNTVEHLHPSRNLRHCSNELPFPQCQPCISLRIYCFTTTLTMWKCLLNNTCKAKSMWIKLTGSDKSNTFYVSWFAQKSVFVCNFYTNTLRSEALYDAGDCWHKPKTQCSHQET